MPTESTGVESVLSSHVERQQVRELERALADRPDRARLVSSTGDVVEIPDAVWTVLVGVIREMALGNAVTVAPATKQLTTQQGAEVLGVSRPYFIKLLEQGLIPFQKVGTHRRVRLADVLAYQDREKKRQHAAMDRLVDISFDSGLDI